MSEVRNSLGQPVGFAMKQWQPCSFPPHIVMVGDYCQLEPLNPERHGEDLYQAFGRDQDHRNWTYLPYGPFENFECFSAWLVEINQAMDPQFYTVIDQKTSAAVGIASYVSIVPAMGSIEVGHIHFSPLLQRTPMSTEAMYLMMKHVFDDLGYRRYEWKCDSLNEASKRAAVRLGFSSEGVFRQALIYKGRNRDTAWFSVIDKEWPDLKRAFQQWLRPENFDTQGLQLQDLKTLQK